MGGSGEYTLFLFTLLVLLPHHGAPNQNNSSRTTTKSTTTANNSTTADSSSTSSSNRSSSPDSSIPAEQPDTEEITEDNQEITEDSNTNDGIDGHDSAEDDNEEQDNTDKGNNKDDENRENIINTNSKKFRDNDNNKNHNRTTGSQTLNTSKNRKSGNSTNKMHKNRIIPDEQRLLNKMFRIYDHSVRPVYNATNNVVVKFGLTLIQIMDMDEKNQVLVTNVWLEHEWSDERIKWDPKDYSQLRVIRIPARKLWLPDIVLYNNADDYTTGYMPSNAMVSFDGTVFWSPPARLRASCKVDITFFPFDEQHCTMKFGSWTYDQAQVDITNRSQEVDMSNYITNGEWALVRTRIIRNEVIYPIGDAIYPDVTITFVMHRRILYYILNILCPCIWLNILSLLSFCLPPDAGEKITLGITVLLSYSVFMLLVAENMPPTSEFVPLIGIYLTLSMAVTSISVILTVCVLKLHHCGPHQSEVPRWMRFLMLNVVARIVRCQCTPLPSAASRNRRNKNSKKASKLPHENAEICLRLVNECNMNKHSPVAEFRNAGPTSNNTMKGGGPPGVRINGQEAGGGTHGHGGHGGGGGGHHTMANMTNIDVTADIKRLSVMEEILKYLKIMVAKRDEDDTESEIINEWRHVAQVMDRFLFWLFLLTTVVATIVMMVIIPLLRYQEQENADYAV